MKHYADNLGSNVAAMIKVRQVDYTHKLLCSIVMHEMRRVTTLRNAACALP